MSLKAKLEAVIYAAEEPVTLAQFASLFSEEALAWKAEREAEAAQDSAEAEAQSGDPAPPSDSSTELAELLEVVENETGVELVIDEVLTESAPEAEPELDLTAAGSDSAESALGGLETAELETSVEPVAPVVEAVVDPEIEAKRLARIREKAVREILRDILDELIAEYASDSRGIEIREIAGGFRMGTKPEIHDAVRAFAKSLKPPMKLSMPALETLAVIAYKQPVTAPEVGEIRGVDSGGVLGSLMSRKLIATAGRKQVIGRPMLYKTTKEFLLRFGLKDLNELPSMEEFEKMAALELSEGDEPDNTTGDLFAEADTAETETTGSEETPTEEPEAEMVFATSNQHEQPQADHEELQALESSNEEQHEAVTIPTAEPSEEAAAAYTPVERQDEE
jgi:segregation and condensation protein B